MSEGFPNRCSSTDMNVPKRAGGGSKQRGAAGDNGAPCVLSCLLRKENIPLIQLPTIREQRQFQAVQEVEDWGWDAVDGPHPVTWPLKVFQG